MGDPRIPYDQTDPMQQVPAPAPGPPQVQPGAPDLGALPPGGPSLAAFGGGGQQPLMGGGEQLGAPQSMAASSDDLTGNQLAALTQPIQASSPEDIQAQELSAALDDPNTPPDQRQQILSLLDLAARRRLAGQAGGL